MKHEKRERSKEFHYAWCPIRIKIKHVVDITVRTEVLNVNIYLVGNIKHMITSIFLFDSQCRNLGTYL